MPIRVTVELIPGGNEEARYVLGSAEIRNTGGDLVEADYDYLLVDAAEMDTRRGKVLHHVREDGWIPLVRRVFEQSG